MTSKSFLTWQWELTYGKHGCWCKHRSSCQCILLNSELCNLVDHLYMLVMWTIWCYLWAWLSVSHSITTNAYITARNILEDDMKNCQFKTMGNNSISLLVVIIFPLYFLLSGTWLITLMGKQRGNDIFTCRALHTRKIIILTVRNVFPKPDELQFPWRLT